MVEIKLKETELEQLRDYVRWAERDGSYYGYKKWWDQRHEAIKIALGMEEDEKEV